MRVPVSWLRELVPAAAEVSVDALAELAVARGLEVEEIHRAKVSGPLVVGRILSSEPEPQKNGKTIRWCSVDVGEDEPRGIVCGAPNAETGALVVVSLPGAVLPGGFAIAARKTYGHVSDGMICSERELGLGEGHDGILVLDDSELPGAVPGAPAAELLGLADEVIELAVTPDRGYCLSMRGVAREIAGALGVPFEDPYRPVMRPAGNPLPATAGIDVVLADPRCARFAMVAMPGVDGSVPSPAWLSSRLTLAGFRPISLVVDVTNYVLVELGQPTHAYDLDTLTGPITVRAARPGERLRTLDGTDRALDAADLLITDATGPIGLAGVMGGESTEISAATTRILVESASFDPVSIARTVRRHKLPSEASRRFERGVDPALATAAAERVAHLLLAAGATGQSGGGWFQTAMTGAAVDGPTAIDLPAQLPTRLLGRPVTDADVVAALEEVGCSVAGGATLTVTPPTWRPDLTDPYDLVEEVARVVGYDTIPTRVPTAPPGPGLTVAQQRRRAVVAALVGAGYVESPSYPFISASVLDTLRFGAGDDRRRLVRVSNPIAGTEPFLRTTLLPGLLAVARRNLGRGADGGQGLALADIGPVVLGPVDGSSLHAPRPPVDARPDDLAVKELTAALPAQPLHLAVVLTGDREPAGWSGSGRAVGWADAVAAVEIVGAAVGVGVRTSAATLEPWHPGRCAAVWAGPVLLGHAGELNPAICRVLDLPERTAAAEIDLDVLLAAAPDAQAPVSPSAFPAAKVDVAVVVAADVPAAEVEAALRSGAGELLESLRLFDIYTGPQVPPGHRSLAYALRLRAADRTLADAEVQAAVADAVAGAGTAVGAVLRSA